MRGSRTKPETTIVNDSARTSDSLSGDTVPSLVETSRVIGDLIVSQTGRHPSVSYTLTGFKFKVQDLCSELIRRIYNIECTIIKKFFNYTK